jgi:heme A synthase
MAAVYVGMSAWSIAGEQSRDRQTARVLTGLLAVQLIAGVVNVLLLAPVWLQLIHLLLADLIWIAYVVLAASRLSRPVLVTARDWRPGITGSERSDTTPAAAPES